MELVATFRIATVRRPPLSLLWQAVREKAGVTREEFDAYFSGLSAGVGIEIADVRAFTPIPLEELRSVWEGFHPPQGFRYVTQGELGQLPDRRLAA